jgi:hypothetical protein
MADQDAIISLWHKCNQSFLLLPVNTLLKIIFRGLFANTFAIKIYFCYTLLYNDGYCCAKDMSPNQTSSQKTHGPSKNSSMYWVHRKTKQRIIYSVVMHMCCSGTRTDGIAQLCAVHVVYEFGLAAAVILSKYSSRWTCKMLRRTAVALTLHMNPSTRRDHVDARLHVVE